MPTVPQVADKVRAAVRNWPVPTIVTETDGAKYDAFKASQAALACSGTVALELALAGLPAVIAYRMNPLTVFLYRRLIGSFDAANTTHVRPEFSGFNLKCGNYVIGDFVHILDRGKVLCCSANQVLILKSLHVKMLPLTHEKQHHIQEEDQGHGKK